MKGIAVFQNKLKGYVKFHSINNIIIITGNIKGLKQGCHGIHIHKYGNLLNKDCEKCGGHYNPYNKNHGGRNSKDRHVGDLGNIYSNNGVSKFRFIMRNSGIYLSGKHSVLGRSVVIHKDKDDLGKGKFSDSCTTGHSGKRLDCAVIGLMDI